ncbi:hypothetical protein ACSBR2_026589 [Camellia fascicularis]
MPYPNVPNVPDPLWLYPVRVRPYPVRVRQYLVRVRPYPVCVQPYRYTYPYPYLIHEQNFSGLGMDAAMDNNSSPYMEELQRCILHFRSEFLSRLLPSSTNTLSAGTENICTRLVTNMASRVLIFFIRHASLVRPLSESGKLRMARDMAELELAVGQNLFPVEQLGAPYRAL